MTSSHTAAPAHPHSLRQTLRDFGRPPRIVGLDIARGIAIIGMIAAHTMIGAGSFSWSEPETWSDLANGRPSILFALLAGISVALMTGRARIPERSEAGTMRLQLVVRGVMIFGFGLVLELLGTNIAVILTFYGILYLIAMLFIRARVRTLVIWSVTLAIVGPSLQAVIGVLMPYGYGAGVQLMLQGTYSVFVWTSLMLAGLALGRLDVTRKKVAAIAVSVGVVLSAVGYTVGALWGADGDGWSYSSSVSSMDPFDDSVYAADTTPGEDMDMTGLVCEDYGDGYISCYPSDYFDDMGSYSSIDKPMDYGANGWADYFETVSMTNFGEAIWVMFSSSMPHSGGTMEILGSGGLALALVGLLLLTGSSLRYPLLPIAAVGTMPLTAYSVHVIVILLVSGPGGYVEDPTFFWWLAGSAVVGCTAWALLLGRGPLEQLTGYVSRTLAAPKPGAAARGSSDTPR